MKKKSKKPRKTYHGPTLHDRLPNSHGERLELIIKFTERAIHNPPRESDQIFVDQVTRLRKELEEWRKNEKN